MAPAHRSAFKISRPLFFLGLASLFTDASSEMVYPLLPLFLTSVLGASAMFVGLVEGVAESTAAFAKYFFGWLSDRKKKRTRFVVGGYALANTMRPFIGVATAPWHVLALRFADRIGKGMRTAPRDAWLAGLVPQDVRGRAYGFHRAMDHAGAVLGPLIAASFLYLFPGKLRPLFLLSLIPGLAATVCVLFAKRSQSKEPPAAPQLSAGHDGASIPRSFIPYFAILFVFTLGGSSDAFLLLKLTDCGVGARFLPLLWSALHVVKSVGSLAGGRITDQIGRRPCIVFGWLWYAVVYATLGFAENKTVVVVTFLSYGLYYGFTESAERAFVAEMVPDSGRGRAFGLHNLVEGLGALPASLLFGFLWKTSGTTTAFLVSAIFAATAALLISFWRLQKHTEN